MAGRFGSRLTFNRCGFVPWPTYDRAFLGFVIPLSAHRLAQKPGVSWVCHTYVRFPADVQPVRLRSPADV
jgi:hypothetical protein